ncbi:MAG TPA: hypothetical protein VE621_12260, partial [Bryobacteraceae bacterium]|nr:hypothetical protein [Bryobacteraceae bacterium]
DGSPYAGHSGPNLIEGQDCRLRERLRTKDGEERNYEKIKEPETRHDTILDVSGSQKGARFLLDGLCLCFTDSATARRAK